MDAGGLPRERSERDDNALFRAQLRNRSRFSVIVDASRTAIIEIAN